jgi:hypothetical protein
MRDSVPYPLVEEHHAADGLCSVNGLPRGGRDTAIRRTALSAPPPRLTPVHASSIGCPEYVDTGRRWATVAADRIDQLVCDLLMVAVHAVARLGVLPALGLMPAWSERRTASAAVPEPLRKHWRSIRKRACV